MYWIILFANNLIANLLVIINNIMTMLCVSCILTSPLRHFVEHVDGDVLMRQV